LSQATTFSASLVPTVLDAAPDAILVIDNRGQIVFANQQVTALFGYAREELIGLSIDALVPDRFRPRHAAHRERYATSGQRRPMGSGLDLCARRKDGSEVPVEVSLSPITEGPGALVAAAIRDVTDRRHAQEELQSARESAERANLAKSRFLATASHDLRQPLQTLALLTGSLRRLVTDADLTRVLAHQDQAIQAMSKLLNALLDISKLESGAIKPELSDFTVQALFEELRNEFAALAAEKGLELAVEPCDDAIHSDQALLGQVLRNLVSNAIKYTRQGCVRLRCLHEQTFICLEVLDTGVGIPAAQLPYICDEFFQVNVPSNVSRDGYGLGLSIVQRITRLLDLKLDVESEVGRGSRFTLRVPAGHERPARVARGPGRPEPAERTAAPLPHVLLVEDDEAVRGATRLLLRVAGYRVSVAASLPEAEALLREHADVEILVTDYHLGSSDTGLQAIAAARAILGPGLRAVLVTGDTSTAVRALECDERTRIASKPINADEFLELLDGLRRMPAGAATGLSAAAADTAPAPR
jgi:PAS domain S-box-containing protein